MSARALRAIYRQLLRLTQQLERREIAALDFRAPLDLDAWPMGATSSGFGFGPVSKAYHLESLRKSLPWLAKGRTSGSFSQAEVLSTVRQQFRSPAAADVDDAERLDRAFDALRVLGEQVHLAERSSSATTEGVNVEVTTAYVGPQSQVDAFYEAEEGVQQKHYFTYRIRISNLGEQTVQLRGRHWLVQNETGQVVLEVARNTAGVVGFTPVLKPNECFTYHSGTDLDSTTGSMHGSFQMVELDAQNQPVRAFDAMVAPFRFIAPPAQASC